MSITIVSAVLALSTVLPNYALNEPDYRGVDRNVLANSTPYPYGRARVVNRHHHATPDFLIAGGRVLTRTPATRDWYVSPGPAWYGAPEDAYVLIGAWVGEVPIVFNPFDKLPTGSPGQLSKAQRLWLGESGLTGQARIVRRASARPHGQHEEQASKSLPEPRAIFRKEDLRKMKRTTKSLPLEVYRTSPDHIVITDGREVLPGSVNGQLASTHK